jgi:hypothetical protein
MKMMIVISAERIVTCEAVWILRVPTGMKRESGGILSAKPLKGERKGRRDQ